MRWFTTDACYVFHPMNAWEEGDVLFADVMEYPVAPLFPKADGTAPSGRRPASCAGRSISPPPRTSSSGAARRPRGEFPRFDERRAGLGYRHGWFAGRSRGRPGDMFDSIAHVDLETGKRATYVFADGDAPGEPVFVPRSAGAPEGDGWILALVYRAAEDRSDLRRIRRARRRGRPDRRGETPPPRSFRLPRQLAPRRLTATIARFPRPSGGGDGVRHCLLGRSGARKTYVEDAPDGRTPPAAAF